MIDLPDLKATLAYYEYIDVRHVFILRLVRPRCLPLIILIGKLRIKHNTKLQFPANGSDIGRFALKLMRYMDLADTVIGG